MLIPPRGYNTTVILNGSTEVDTEQRGDAVYEEFVPVSYELTNLNLTTIHTGNIANRDSNELDIQVNTKSWVISGDLESYNTAAEIPENELPYTTTVEELFNEYNWGEDADYEYKIDISLLFDDAAASFDITVDGSVVKSKTVNANGTEELALYQDTGNLANYSNSVPVVVSVSETADTTTSGTITVQYQVGSELTPRINSASMSRK